MFLSTPKSTLLEQVLITAMEMVMVAIIKSMETILKLGVFSEP